MPITIIKKANAPVLPRADPLVVEPHCNFQLIAKEVDVDIGEGLELYRCQVCGETRRDPRGTVVPVAQCLSRIAREARQEKRR